MKKRIEEWLVERGLAKDLELARSLVMEGRVFLGQERVRLASQLAEENAELSLREKPRYASRGGYKLERAMEAFSLRLEGLRCLDVGSSTGGFTDCMLQNGAARVYAIDVGYGQLDWKIRNDDRVTVMERTNARYLTHAEVPCVPDVTVMDVSFISVRLILPVAAELMEHRGRFYILIKPQFEAGKENVGKKGVVRDPRVHRQVVEDVAAFAPTFGYRMAQVDFSPITGPEGNIEYIAELLPGASGAPAVTAERIAQVVEQAHATLN